MLEAQEEIIHLRQAFQQAQEKMQAVRIELYRRRGQDVPILKPEELIQSGQSDEHTRLQEALNLTLKMVQLYENELQRMTVASRQKTTGDRPLTPLSKRGYLLTGWLTLSVIGGILYIIFLVISGMAFSGGGLLAVALQILALSGMNGIWNLQKWGYYFLAFLYIAAIILLSFSGRYAIITGDFEIASDLFQLIVLSLIVLPRWKYLD